MLFPRRRDRSAIAGWAAVFASLGALLGMAFLPSPYVVEQPGPTFDTLGETDAGPLITVPADLDHPDSEGSLTLLTVSIAGNPQRPLTWVEVAGAFLDPADEILPMDAVYAPDETIEQSNEAGRVEMQSSQAAAIAAALLHEGYEIDAEVTIAEVLAGSPAEGRLEVGDRILSVNGETAYDVYSIREAIAAVDGASTFDVERDGERLTVTIEPIEEQGQRLVGIVPQNAFTFPIDVSIELPNVGGPSAGMMFALGIVDRLTPGSLTGGVDWAGTGTISATGDVGPIGGIEQKMHGALDSGADWFLAPVENCGEVVGNVPDGLRVVAVDTLDDAMTAIETVAAGGDVDALPTCTAG
ncbi:YlbL family protein [Agrococcus sp. SGAir0287]|uniref:YlbL family protein n=1 Tax=Agrococcus sp. SGAir0287 TaxID=2070347 RepID=UPI0010CCF01F|nr:S16 family serine protease [Agrococcus sp. SGAir0287]QCR18888.1 ATP-dependent serine peptidase containing a PDZ domain protein [Agrococcus sp. SGAir0287]